MRAITKKHAEFARLCSTNFGPEHSIPGSLWWSRVGGPGVYGRPATAAAADRRLRGLSASTSVLPHEQAPHLYVTPELCFNFHYFANRKMHSHHPSQGGRPFLPGGFRHGWTSCSRH